MVTLTQIRAMSIINGILTSLLETLLTIRDTTEGAVRILKLRGLSPPSTACMASRGRVMVLLRTFRLSHEENCFIFVKIELA